MAVNGVTNQASYQGLQNNTTAASTNVQRTEVVKSVQPIKVQSENASDREQIPVDKEAEKARLESIINEVNNKLTQTRCEYSYHDEINRLSIKVVDKETNKVIKEIPPEESFKAIEKLWEIAGLLLDEKR